jgi:hypothetical protein
LSAQVVRASGRLLHADSSAAPHIRVILHRVGQSTQGPLDSTRSDRQGRFQFSFRPDTPAFYLVSGRYAGIEYFSTPLATNPAKPDTGLRIVVYDTSSSAPVELEARHVVITRATGESGGRGVLDLLVLRNNGTRTRVAIDTVRGSWTTALLKGSAGLQLSEGDVSAAAIRRSGDSLVVLAALAPGEKQLTLQYEIPSSRRVVELPVSAGLSLNVMAEEPAVKVAAPGIVPVDSQVLQGRSFRRWSGIVASPAVLRVTLPGPSQPPRWLLPGLVALLAFALLAAGGYGLRRQAGAAIPESRQLIHAIAVLDAQFLGKRQEMSDQQWAEYELERARLKRQLETTLAARGGSP